MVIDLKKIVDENANTAHLYKSNTHFKKVIDRLVETSFGSHDLVMKLVDYIGQLHVKYNM